MSDKGWEWLRVDGKLVRVRSSKDPVLDPNKEYFIKGTRPDAKEKLDEIGATFAKLMTLKREAMRKERLLIAMYLADCKRLGVKPVEIDRSVM